MSAHRRDTALDAAEAALTADRPADAIPLLLESWRARRATVTAELLDAISILSLDPSRLADAPLDVYSHPTFYDWLPMTVHPFSSLPPPDPRATVPLLLSAKNALHSDYNPSFPAPLAEQLRAHGDPRAIGFLDRLLAGAHGPFGEDRSKLERALPRPAELDAESARVLRRMAAEVERRAPLEHLEAALAAPSTPRKARVIRSFGIPSWLGELLWIIDAPRIERGMLVGGTLRPRLPWLIEASLGQPAWRNVRELSFLGDAFWARAERPPWWASSKEPWTGSRTRAAVSELLHELAGLALRHVFALPPEVVAELARARRDWPFTVLSLWLSESDKEAHEMLRRALAECSLPSLTKLTLLGTVSSPEALAWCWALPIGEKLREIELTSPFAGWDLWLASGALPRNVHGLTLHGGDWTADISRDEDNELSRVSLNLSEKWESYEPIAEDPPMPGADLIDLLRRLPDDRLTSLWVDNLGELGDEGRAELLREARRQRWLSELILPGEDGEPAPMDLSAGM